MNGLWVCSNTFCNAEFFAQILFLMLDNGENGLSLSLFFQLSKRKKCWLYKKNRLIFLETLTWMPRFCKCWNRDFRMRRKFTSCTSRGLVAIRVTFRYLEFENVHALSRYLGQWLRHSFCTWDTQSSFPNFRPLGCDLNKFRIALSTLQASGSQVWFANKILD